MGLKTVKLKAVCNSTPLITLSQIDALRLLSLFDELIVPKTVYEEIEVGGIPEAMETIDHEIIECEEVRPEFESLDKGEANALSLIEERHERTLFLTDDLEARKSAKEKDIEVHGSVGIVVLAYSREILELETAEKMMRDIQEETELFVTDEIVEIGIKELKRLAD